MLSRDAINNAYFEWMYDLVCTGRFSSDITYKKLLMRLHTIEFTYTIRRDRARASDGIDLRYRFPYEQFGIDDVARYIDGPCSVLEMILALAICCEETIMDNPAYGDRTGQWFWRMIANLGISTMNDDNFDRQRVDDAVYRFLKRDYEPNGKGGLFVIRNCTDDLRKVEIWTQLCWYLNSIR